MMTPLFHVPSCALILPALFLLSCTAQEKTQVQEDGTNVLASHAIQCTFEDDDGRLWFGGWLGLYRLDGKAFVNVTAEGPWSSE